MGRRHIAALAATIVLAVSACDGGTGATPDPERTPSAADRSVEPGDASPSDPLEAESAAKLAGIDGVVIRADDGTAVVVSTNEYATRTTYRIYDPRWRPLTPVLQLRGDVIIDRGLANTFFGNLTASREKGHPRVNERIIISSDGTLTTVDDQAGRASQPVRTRPGDRRLASVGSGRLVYRPADRTVHRTTTPEWDARSRSWYVTAAGDICALGSRDRIGVDIHASVDEGRTFTDLSTAVLPADYGPRVQSCETAGNRVAVMTGGEYPKWVHVLNRTTGALLASHFVGDQHGPYDPYGWRLLPDGKLVFDSNRPGLYVATDISNRVLEYRPHPRLPHATTIVIGNDLGLLAVPRHLYVSSDEGRTWARVEL